MFKTFEEVFYLIPRKNSHLQFRRVFFGVSKMRGKSRVEAPAARVPLKRSLARQRARSAPAPYPHRLPTPDRQQRRRSDEHRLLAELLRHRTAQQHAQQAADAAQGEQRLENENGAAMRPRTASRRPPLTSR
jgi:hypothetical protein